MKTKSLAILLSAMLGFMMAFSLYISRAEALEREAIAKKAMMERHKYTTTVGTFNGKVEIVQRDRFGRRVGKYSVILMPGQNLEVPGQEAMKKGRITWKDVAQYENVLARDPDPISQWFVESLWRDRINRVLTILEDNLRKKYPRTYKRMNISIESVAMGLGMKPPIGFLTGEHFVKVPDTFGGRIPNIDPRIVEKNLETSRYLASYVSSNPYIEEIIDDIQPPEEEEEEEEDESSPSS